MPTLGVGCWTEGLLRGPRDLATLDDNNGWTEPQPRAPLQRPCTNTKADMTLIVLAVLGLVGGSSVNNGMPFFALPPYDVCSVGG
jgi:hypothetical protein